MKKQNLIFNVEKWDNESNALKICNGEGKLVRYYGMLKVEAKSIEKFADMLRSSDCSIINIDDYVLDFIYCFDK